MCRLLRVFPQRGTNYLMVLLFIMKTVKWAKLSSRKTLMRLKQSDEFHCCYILMYCCNVSCFCYFVHLLRSLHSIQSFNVSCELFFLTICFFLPQIFQQLWMFSCNSASKTSPNILIVICHLNEMFLKEK